MATAIEPFDNRLKRLLKIKSINVNNAKGDYTFMQSPFYASDSDENSYNTDSNVNEYTMTSTEINSMNTDNDSEAIETANTIDKYAQSLINDKSKNYQGVASLMNPYAFTRLFGSEGGAFLVDASSRRKYYEIDGDDSGHYAKNPTTSNIIKWGSADKYGRHNYQYQDFVFCKHWNVIPNNRMITLRRFSQPTFDNLNFPGMEKGTISTHPVATAITYFGEGTDNTLSNLLKFTAGYGWTAAEGEVWNVTGQAPSMESLNKATGLDKFCSTGVINMASVLGLVGQNGGNGNENFDFNAEKGLPNDPYITGPYSNRILGPVNKINKVFKRDDKGLSFKMDGLTLNFDYVARPIGGINPKAVLLDLLANFLVLGYSSAVFFGGAHRFQINPTRYPFNDSSARQKLWEGKILGKDGASQSLIKTYKEKMEKGLGSGGVGSIFQTLADTAAGLMGDLFGAMGINNSMTDFLNGRTDKNKNANNLKTNVEQMVAASIQSKVGQLPYLDNMKSILTGEPVGDWHLVIGNPMNPIAEIGNLICENITIQFSDELGQDDFPIGFKASISLKHGMERDRDGIEAMFNKGAGRIYILPDKYSSSADGQTVVDSKTNVKGNGAFNWQSVPKVAAKNTYSIKGQMDNQSGHDAYTSIGTPGFIDNTINLRNAFTNKNSGYISHPIMPWQIKIVM